MHQSQKKCGWVLFDESCHHRRRGLMINAGECCAKQRRALALKGRISLYFLESLSMSVRFNLQHSWKPSYDDVCEPRVQKLICNMMYVCIYIYIYVCVIYDMNRTHIHINRYAYVRTQTHRHRHIMTHIFMYQCIYDDMYIYIYTHMYLNTYLHIYT